eukprot:15386285-Alexandrium_andersonii.AAC.1
MCRGSPARAAAQEMAAHPRGVAPFSLWRFWHSGSAVGEPSTVRRGGAPVCSLQRWRPPDH